jgi:hypothetical protein
MNFSTTPPCGSIWARAIRVGRQHLVDILWIGGLGEGGEPDQVAEERRDDLAFLPGSTSGCTEGCGAMPAESLPFWVLMATRWTDRHRSERIRWRIDLGSKEPICASASRNDQLFLGRAIA